MISVMPARAPVHTMASVTLRPLAPLFVCILGCGGSDKKGEDAGIWNGDASAPECAPGVEPLVLGRCETAAGTDCTGDEDKTDAGDFHFVPIDGHMTLVVGPQGYTMFVGMARVEGIDAGDPADRGDWPSVEIVVVDEETGRQATYREYKPFVPDPDAPGSFVNDEQFWVVTATSISFDLAGHPMSAVGEVHDRGGGVRCGTATFMAERQ